MFDNILLFRKILKQLKTRSILEIVAVPPSRCPIRPRRLRQIILAAARAVVAAAVRRLRLQWPALLPLDPVGQLRPLRRLVAPCLPHSVITKKKELILVSIVYKTALIHIWVINAGTETNSQKLKFLNSDTNCNYCYQVIIFTNFELAELRFFVLENIIGVIITRILNIRTNTPSLKALVILMET